MSDYISREEAKKEVYLLGKNPSVNEIWDCLDTLPSSDAAQGGRYENAMQKLREMPRYLNGVKTKQIKKISVDAEVSDYAKWLEDIIVKVETFEWLCEDATDEEWCEKNCNYASIQAECLRHLYEVSKGGDTE